MKVVAVPKLSGTRDRFRGRQFLHGWGSEGGREMVQAILQAMVQAVMRAMQSGR